jgi:excisionase family DNA binding protein
MRTPFVALRSSALLCAAAALAACSSPPAAPDAPPPPRAEACAYSVVEAGQRLGLGRNASYEAARKGQIPTLRIGGRILVPCEALERMLSEA